MSGQGDNGEEVKMSSSSGSTGSGLSQMHALPRPRLAPQQSNSVPSTPRQHPRDFAFNRTPSPTLDGTDSPRSAISEAIKPFAASRGLLPNCRYMSTQTSRRRIPYEDSTPLPKETRPPKVSLEVNEEQKLSGDMRELYDRLLPTPDSVQKRQQVVDKLQNILAEEWPGKAVQVAVFGSSGNQLFTNKSDVDVCVMMPDLQTTCILADLLAKRGMQQVKCVHAKGVPIVKILDPELQLYCDLNLNNQVAVKNTQLVRTYIELDERVRPLAMVVKHWTKKRVINEASGGTLSSYTWTLLLINFLQTRQPPVLPVLPLMDEEGKPRSDYKEDLERFRGFGDENTETMAELLFQFFRHYGHEIDYETDVVSVRTGKLLTKLEKNWHLGQNNPFCVEEPFNTERNLANTADSYAIRGINLEFRQAFDRLTEGKDIETSVCEQFQFPEGGIKTVFERPTPQPKPILSRSQSQSGRSSTRSNGAMRGNRYQSSQRNGPNNRRASNPAAYNQNPHALLQSPQYIYPQADYILRGSPQQIHAQPGIHDQLTQMSQQINQEEQRLRALLSQTQMQQVAQAQAHVLAAGQGRSATLPARTHGLPMLQTYRGSRLGSMEEPPATAPLHRGQSYASLYDLPATLTPQSSTNQGTDTNPSSPQLTPSVPRRQFQRQPVPQTQSNSTRSQSQPARGVPQPFVVPRGTYGAMPAVSQLQMANVMQRQNYYGPFVGPAGQYYLGMPQPMIEQIPREYLGYGYGVPGQYVSAYPDQTSSTVDGLDIGRQASSSTAQNIPSSLPDSWLASNNGQDVSSAENISRSEPGSLQPIIPSGHGMVNGSRGIDQHDSGSARNSPHRRRTLDLPYRSDASSSGPGVHVSIGNAYQSNPVQATVDDDGPSAPVLNSGFGTTATSWSSGISHPKSLTNGKLATSPLPMASSPSSSLTASTGPSASQLENGFSSDVIDSRRSSAGARAAVPPLDLTATSSAEPTSGQAKPPETPVAVLSPVRETSTPVESPVVARTLSSDIKEKPDKKQDVRPTSAKIVGSKPLVNGVGSTHTRTPPAAKSPPTASPKLAASNTTPISNTVASKASLNSSNNTENTKPPSTNVTNSNHTVTANSTSASIHNAPPARTNAVNTNPWQQATSKKGRKGKTMSLDRTNKGEPLPERVEDRKGG